MPEPKGQFRYGLFAHRGDGRYVWDERIGKIYYRQSSAQQAADRMNERGEHGGNVVVRSESWTQHYPRRNRPQSRARAIAVKQATKRRRNPTRPRSRAPSIQKKYNTTVNALHVEYFQGYAEDIRYLRGADGKPYSHVVETDSAELYLCEHATYGKCLLIVDPSGKTPLWG